LILGFILLLIIILKTMTENEIAKEIFDSSYYIHYTLGPGLYEIVYENILAHELTKKRIACSSAKRNQS
jgi:GxxExxY protein